MKRILIIICAILCFSSCEKMLVSSIDAVKPDPLVSFLANGEEFTVSGVNVNAMRIYNFGAEGFSMRFSNGGYWDTDNTLESVVLSLDYGLFHGSLKKGNEYVFSAEDSDVFPYLKYTVREELESAPNSSSYRQMTMWYNASHGRIKITRLNKKKGLISGRFEFTAVCDDPSNGDVIEITEGVFNDISYKISDAYMVD